MAMMTALTKFQPHGRSGRDKIGAGVAAIGPFLLHLSAYW